MQDNQHLLDGLSASIEADRAEPLFPCSQCGSETKLHIEYDLEKHRRICSNKKCRKIQDQGVEKIQIINGRSVRFACKYCGHETKQYSGGMVEKTKARICSNKNCLYKNYMI